MEGNVDDRPWGATGDTVINFARNSRTHSCSSSTSGWGGYKIPAIGSSWALPVEPNEPAVDNQHVKVPGSVQEVGLDDVVTDKAGHDGEPAHEDGDGRVDNHRIDKVQKEKPRANGYAIRAGSERPSHQLQ